MLLALLWIISAVRCFDPAVNNYDTLTITNGGKISMSIDGSAYTIMRESAVHYYKRINNVYTFVDKIGTVCSLNTKMANCYSARQWMSSDGKRVFYVHDSSTNTLKVAQLVNSTLQSLPDITFPNSLSGQGGRSADGGTVQAKEDFLLISDYNYLQMYKFNYITQQYQKIFFANYVSRKCTYSTDGKYIICLSVTLNANIYTYDGTSYILTSMQVPNNNGASQMLGVVIVTLEQLNSTTYTLTIHYNSITGMFMQYFSLVNSLITFVQLIDQTFLTSIYLSKNARYLVAAAQQPFLRLYQFDQTTGQFTLTHNFIITSALMNLFVSQDAKIMLFYYLISDSPEVQAVMYFKCEVSNCLSCSNLGQCAKCASTFTLTNNHTCACNSTQTLLSNLCITCSIPLCSGCAAVNSCLGCQKNFILANNLCVCPSGSTVSQLDGSCVLCSLENCYRCDQNNTCAFSIPKEDISKAKSEEGISKAESAAIGLAVILFVVFGAAIVYLYLKLKAAMNQLSKIGSLQQKQSFQQKEDRLNQTSNH